MKRLLEELKKYNDITNEESILFISSTKRSSINQYFNIIPLSKLPEKYLEHSNNYLTILNIIKMIHTLVEIEGTSEFKLNKIFGKDILNLRFCYKVSSHSNFIYVLRFNIRYNCNELAILLSIVDLLSANDIYIGALTYESFDNPSSLEESIITLINKNISDE